MGGWGAGANVAILRSSSSIAALLCMPWNTTSARVMQKKSHAQAGRQVGRQGRHRDRSQSARAGWETSKDQRRQGLSQQLQGDKRFDNGEGSLGDKQGDTREDKPRQGDKWGDNPRQGPGQSYKQGNSGPTGGREAGETSGEKTQRQAVSDEPASGAIAKHKQEEQGERENK